MSARRRRQKVGTSHHPAVNLVYKRQADATYAGTPSTGVAVGVLAATANCKIISISFTPVFSGGSSHTADIIVTIDGQTITFTGAAVSTTPVYPLRDSDDAASAQDTTTTDPAVYGVPYIMEGRSISVTVKLTTDGTPGASSARVKYAKIP